jgi:hypothetical protein
LSKILEKLFDSNFICDTVLFMATAAGFKVIVHFATSTYEKVVATLPTREQAERRSWEYLGADARGVWIESPEGVREIAK